MRVLIVTAWVPWRIVDGGSLVLHHHLRFLARDHEIRILAPDGPPGEKRIEGDGDMLPPGVTMRWFGNALPKPIDHAVRRVRSTMSGEPAHVFWVERRALLRALDEELTARPPSIVHLHGWGTARLWRRARGISTVHAPLDAWELGTRNRLLPSYRAYTEWDQHRKVAAHERRHYPRCGAVVVVAQADAVHLRATSGARVEVVPNGVEPGEEPRPPADAPVVGFHGVYQTAANRDAALTLANEIFPRIRAVVPDARLLLIGRDPGPEILRLAGADVQVTGAVSDVRPWLERVSVYVAPLVSGTGIKNKVLEAMAAGLPVVATRRALDGIGEGPGVVAADSADELAGRAIALLRSGEARRAAGRAARERVVRDFTWEQSARAIEELWLELAD